MKIALFSTFCLNFRAKDCELNACLEVVDFIKGLPTHLNHQKTRRRSKWRCGERMASSACSRSRAYARRIAIATSAARERAPLIRPHRQYSACASGNDGGGDDGNSDAATTRARASERSSISRALERPRACAGRLERRRRQQPEVTALARLLAFAPPSPAAHAPSTSLLPPLPFALQKPLATCFARKRQQQRRQRRQ